MTESRRLGLRIALPAIGVAVALLLAGCSSSGGASSTSAASKTNFGGVKLTVWNSIDYNPYEAQQKSFFEKCGKKLGITVDDQTINGDYASALLKAAGSKSLPGIVQLSTDVELPTLAAEGALANLHSLGVSTEGESSSVSSLGTYKGTLYGLPSNIENYAIFYDKVAFANAGISTPPATFADFVADAKKVTSSTEAGVAFSGNRAMGRLRRTSCRGFSAPAVTPPTRPTRGPSLRSTSTRSSSPTEACRRSSSTGAGIPPTSGRPARPSSRSTGPGSWSIRR